MAKSILKSVHETAKGLHKAGTMDAVTMREFDAAYSGEVEHRFRRNVNT